MPDSRKTQSGNIPPQKANLQKWHVPGQPPAQSQAEWNNDMDLRFGASMSKLALRSGALRIVAVQKE
jgi:hypothetical protein